MELEITALASSGHGVGRCNGEVVFAAGALPGERVRVRFLGRRRKVQEAVTEEVLVASSWREETPCPLAFDRCGGCDLAHVSLPFRKQALAACLQAALRGGPEPLKEAVQQAVFYPSPWHYRLRGTLHWDSSTKTLGFFAPRSHRVTELSPCRILSRQLVALLPSWREALARWAFPSGELAFLEDLVGERRLVLWKNKVQAVPKDFPGVQGFFTSGGRGWGAHRLVLDLPRPLTVFVETFVQGNRFLLPELWQLVARLVSEEGVKKVLDLYAGVGFLAAAAYAGGAAEVTAVEVSRRASAGARENLPQANVLPKSAEEVAATGMLRGQDLIIVDPPRGGLSLEVREALGTSNCPLLLYFSCDPACLARDAQALTQRGYRVAWAKLYDLFVGTHHGELAVLFRRS